MPSKKDSCCWPVLIDVTHTLRVSRRACRVAGWMDLVKIPCHAADTELQWLFFMLPIPCSAQQLQVRPCCAGACAASRKQTCRTRCWWMCRMFSQLWVCDKELLSMQGNEFKLSIWIQCNRLFRGSALFKQLFVSAQILKEDKLTFQQSPKVVWYPALHAEQLVDSLGRCYGHWETGMDWLAQGYFVSVAIFFFSIPDTVF